MVEGMTMENSQRTTERPQYFEWVVLLLSFHPRRLELIWLELKELLPWAVC
jgi:hypothetical protein